MIATLVLAAAYIVPAGETFTCTPTRVWDGDGPVWCSEGPRLRLLGIAAREKDGSCRPHHPCPSATPEAATRALVRLLGPTTTQKLKSGHVGLEGAPALMCVSGGSAQGNRTAAECRLADGRSLSCAMIKTGTVLEWPRYSEGRLRRCKPSSVADD